MKIKPKQKNRNPATSKAPPPNQIIHYHINEITPKPNHPKNRNLAKHPTHPLQNQTIIKEAKIGLGQRLALHHECCQRHHFLEPFDQEAQGVAIFSSRLALRPRDEHVRCTCIQVQIRFCAWRLQAGEDFLVRWLGKQRFCFWGQGFRELPLPKCLEDQRVQIEVGALGDCVSVTANYGFRC